MKTDQAAGLADRARRRSVVTLPVASGSSLALVSGKGGVGKSALAVNLAWALASGAASRGTLLVDGDAGLANADLLLGRMPRGTLAEALDQGAEPWAAIEPIVAGLDLLVSGRSAAVAPALEGLAALDDRSRRYGLRLFDLGAGISGDVLGVAGACSRIWLVATPEPTSLADAYTTARRLWARFASARIELIVNRVPDSGAGVRTHQALERLTRRFLGRALPLRAVLPEDPALARSVARQEPVVAGEVDAPIARRIRLLAESLAEDPQDRLERRPVSPAALPHRSG